MGVEVKRLKRKNFKLRRKLKGSVYVYVYINPHPQTKGCNSIKQRRERDSELFCTWFLLLIYRFGFLFLTDIKLIHESVLIN